MINLTTFVDNARAIRVMKHVDRVSLDIGTASDVFGSKIALIQVGDTNGSDDYRGAYEWYSLTINGETIGELRDDANGLTIHINA